MIMKAEKSQGLPSACWGPRRVESVVLVWEQRPENQESWRCKFQFKSQPAQDSRRAHVLVWVWKLERMDVPAKSHQAVGVPSYTAFLFYLSLQLIRWDPPTLGRTICFTQSTHSNVNLTQSHPHRYTRIMFVQTSGHPVAQSSWHIKLTITVCK